VEEVFFKDPVFMSIKQGDNIDASLMEHIKYLAKDASLNLIDKGADRNIPFLPSFSEADYQSLQNLS